MLVIACSVLKNEFLAVNSDGAHFEFLEQGLHKSPDKMRPAIQEKIDEVNNDIDYVALGYGLCGNGTLGIKAKKQPLVIPVSRNGACLELNNGVFCCLSHNSSNC